MNSSKKHCYLCGTITDKKNRDSIPICERCLKTYAKEH